MLIESLDFWASYIPIIFLNGQFNGQLLKGQFDQNPPNLLFHTSFGSYPRKPLSNPLSTMHKQGAKKMSGGENISSTQSQKC